MNPGTARRLGGRYRLDQQIAVGGMGEVWRGTDEVLNRSVAVKLLRPNLTLDDPLRQRFRTEAQVAAMLRHEGIAALYDYGESDDSAYIVMELVDGEPLSTLIGRHGTLGTDRTLGLMAQAAKALQAAHERGVVHRDVKPANIMVTRDGQVKITDFGIARRADHEPLTATGQVMGTAHYLAPEVAAGHTASPLSDVYALGIVTYECLAGWRPFDGDNQVAVATAQLRQPPPPLPETLNPQVSSLVMRVLSKDPARRPQSAALLAAEFETLRRRPRTGSVPTGSLPTGSLPTGSLPTAAGIGAAAGHDAQSGTGAAGTAAVPGPAGPDGAGPVGLGADGAGQDRAGQDGEGSSEGSGQQTHAEQSRSEQSRSGQTQGRSSRAERRGRAKRRGKSKGPAVTPPIATVAVTAPIVSPAMGGPFGPSPFGAPPLVIPPFPGPTPTVFGATSATGPMGTAAPAADGAEPGPPDGSSPRFQATSTDTAVSPAAPGTSGRGGDATVAVAAGSPAAGSPAAGSPAVGSPAVGSPAVGSPAVGSPAVGSPAVGIGVAGIGVVAVAAADAALADGSAGPANGGANDAGSAPAGAPSGSTEPGGPFAQATAETEPTPEVADTQPAESNAAPVEYRPDRPADAHTEPFAIPSPAPSPRRSSSARSSSARSSSERSSQGGSSTLAALLVAPPLAASGAPQGAEGDELVEGDRGRWRGPLIALLGVASLVMIGTVAFDAAFGGSPEEGRAVGAPIITVGTSTTETTTTTATTTRRARLVARPTPTRATTPPTTTRPPRTTISTRPPRRTTAPPTTAPATDTVLIRPGAHYAEQVGDAVRMLSEQGFAVSVVYVTGDGNQPQNTVVDVRPTGDLPRGSAIVVSAVTPQNGG